MYVSMRRTEVAGAPDGMGRGLVAEGVLVLQPSAQQAACLQSAGHQKNQKPSRAKNKQRMSTSWLMSYVHRIVVFIKMLMSVLVSLGTS